MVAAVLASLILGTKIEPDFSGAWDYAKVRGANAVVVMIDGMVAYQVGEVDNRKQLLASGTKSLTGTAMACAIQDKLFTGWDEKLEVAIPEWNDDDRGDITYRQLLGLNSGLEVSTSGGSFVAPTEKEMLATEVQFAAGRRFIYGPMPFNIFSLAIERKLKGEKLQNYLDRRVFEPLGISMGYKGVKREGRVQIAGMGECAPLEWVKLGELWRNNGKLNDKQLWDANAFSEVSKSHGPGRQYGLSFWLSPSGNPMTGGGRASEFKGLFMAAGAGQQLNIVIPEEKAVVVRTGSERGDEGAFDAAEFLKILFRR